MSGLGGWLRRLAWLSFTIVLVFAAFSARVILEGESEISASDAAFDRGELGAALDHARRSATLYAPGAPHVDRAYARLTAIAQGAEAAAQPKVAALAWQAIRSAALESRHVILPHAAELERANQNLARLESPEQKANDNERVRTQAQALSRLSADDAPSPRWIAVLGLGFALALVGLALFAFQGVDRAGRVSLARARLGLLLFAIGAACWTVAAYRA
jgi:Ca2+/Na+ antiporter